MDLAPRATAAQLAARSIKTKPKGRAGARPGMGASQSSASGDSVPLFAPMPEQGAPAVGGGGLFGGAVQAPSSFNFSSSSGPSLSFPPTTFGGSTFGNGRSTPETERLEDTRNPKRKFNGPGASGNQEATFATPNTSNMFGGLSASVGNTNSASTSPFPFNGVSQSFPPTNTPGPTPSTSFAFGNTSSATTSAVPSVGFGGGPNANSGNPFNFNDSAPKSTAFASPSPFGNPSPAQPATTPFNFGQNATSGAAVKSTLNTTAPATNGNTFGFGQTVSASSAPGFAPTAASDTPVTKSCNNLFGGISSRPTSASPGLFGFATSQTSAPAGGIFGNHNSGNLASQAGASPGGVSFGSNPPAFTPFKGFGTTQESSTVKPSVDLFAKKNMDPKPAFAGFGNPEHNVNSPTNTNIFGSLGQTAAKTELPKDTPSKPLFGGQQQSAAKPADNIFSGQDQNTLKSTNGLFGAVEQMPVKGPSNNLFGKSGEEPAKSTGDLFGATSQPPTTAGATPSNPFANLAPPPSPKPAPATIPESSKQSPNLFFNNTSAKSAASTNIFGDASSLATPNNEPLSTLNQPFDQPTPKINDYSHTGNNAKSNTSGLSLPKTPSSSGNPSSLHPPSTSSTLSPQSAVNGHPLISKSLSASRPHTPAVSSRLREVQSADVDGIDKDEDAPEEPNPPESFLQPAGHNSWINIDGDPSTYPQKFPGLEYASRYPIEKMEHLAGSDFTHEQLLEFYTAYRMSTLNQALQRYFMKIGISDNIFPALAYYNSLRQVILQRTAPDLKRKAIDEQGEENQHQSKRARGAQRASPPKQIAPSSPFKAIETPKAAGSSQPFLNGNTPSMAPRQSSQSKSALTTTPFKPTSYFAPPQTSPPKSATSATAPLKANSSPAPTRHEATLKFTPPTAPPEQPSAALSLSKGKRKGEDLTKDDFEASERSSPLKRAKMNTSTEASSNTSSRFKNALNGPTKPLPGANSPDKANTEEQPKKNPFASLLPPTANKPAAPTASKLPLSSATSNPQSSSPAAAFSGSTSSPTMPTVSGANLAAPKPLSFMPAAFMPTVGSLTSPAPTFTPPKFSLGGGATSNFMSQFGAKASEDQEKKEKELLQKAIDEDYDSDDNLEEFKANYKKKRATELKELKEAASTKTGGFVLKPTVGPSTSSAPTCTPPKFSLGGGATSNFMSQFGAKASEDQEKKEKELLQKAIDEDYDSDDNLEEFKANYKKKRATELKELKEAASKTVGGFVLKPSGPPADKPSHFLKDPSSGTTSSEKPSPFIFKATSGTTSPEKPSPFVFKPTSDVTSTPELKDSRAKTTSSTGTVSGFKSSSGISTPSKPSGGGVFDSVQSSRAQTPTSFSFASSTSQAVRNEPVAIDKSNIFGHLSQQNSRAGSENRDSDDEEDPESDSENKDPSYKPGQESKSRPGTPSTPVEDTGVGIASTKKAKNPFTFGSSTPTPALGAPSTSGTSTPKRSLFDRIQTDDKGNPIRDLPPSSSEEKENTQPTTSGLFGNAKNTTFSFESLNKPAGSPSDQTWKVDTPIKFGGATPAKAFAPAVTVQAATPPKPFGELFGSIKSTTAPTNGSGTSTPSIFAGIGNPKPATFAAVNFSFGGASGGSSLFPSTAGSAATSRATTPGATTDGDSAAEGNEPDAEKHEQIDLTSGGLGEEDETNIHEVRAKALKYTDTPKEGASPWEVKGVGPMRVLQHKDTKAVRLLLRGDPSGKVILNKALLSGVKYEATQKTLKLMTAADDGKGLETWILQVKTPEIASELAKVLEDNKACSSS